MFGPKLIATFDQGKGYGVVDLELGILKDEEAAVKQFSNWINDNRVRFYMLMQYPPLVMQEREWARKAGESQNSITWAIYANGSLIGSMGIDSIDFTHSHAELGILIGNKEWWGKGIATVAEMLVTEYAFHCIVPGGLSKLYARVIVGNDASRKALKHVGFKDIGVLRREHYAHGQWFDVWIGDILREEWIAKREEKFRSAGVTSYSICPNCDDVVSLLRQQ